MPVNAHYPFRRNLFEIENARNLTRHEVVQTFVSTQAFWRMLSPKHHVLVGARGSGKTAIAKMLTHDHLSQYAHPRVRNVVANKELIGLYVATRLDWVGGLKNWHLDSDRERTEYFIWKLNIATCLACLQATRSCLDTYIADRVERAQCEIKICTELSKAWIEGEASLFTISDWIYHLEAVEYRRQQQLARQRITGSIGEGELAGISFDVDLFAPLRRGIQIIERALGLPSHCAWLLCIDEAEFLDDTQQRFLNSFMRGNSGNLFLKIATMPYRHLASETSTSVTLDSDNDFSYVYLDSDPALAAAGRSEKGRIGTRFARKLFAKRVSASRPFGTAITADQLLGKSELLDPKPGEDWSVGSANFELLERYASVETIARAKTLADNPSRKARLHDQVVRKMRGALLLRDKVAMLKGRETFDAYAGASMVMRCGDNNARRIIRIFNSMLLSVDWDADERPHSPRLAPGRQTQVLTRFSDELISSVRGEPQVGHELYLFLERIGKFMQDYLYKLPLTTDQVSSIEIDQRVSAEEWKLIERAVELGLLFPNMSSQRPNALPVREGVFHLAYALAPHFALLPRRGKSRKLRTVLRYSVSVEVGGDHQLSLFETLE